MIQARELRIGNIVQIGDLTRGTTTVCVNASHVFEVTLISYLQVHIHQIHNQGFGTVFYNELSPIPLTPELLEKCCGFKKATEYIYDHKSGIIFDAPNDWNNPNNYPIGIDCSRSLYGFNPEQIIIRTLTLHDLQNKFYSITGEELEVDLTALQS